MAKARHFEFVADTSTKFWEIQVEGKSFVTRYGKIGTEGQTTTKSFASPAEAAAEAEKLVGEKTRKGYVERAPSAGKESAAATVMDEVAFWKIIDAVRSKAKKSDDAFLQKLAARLGEMDPPDILRFQRILQRLHSASYSAKLWGAAYLVNGGCSDDGFDYFRAWLIAQGRAAFEGALKDPDTLASFGRADAELEELLYAAQEAYEEKTGKDMPESALMGGDDEESELGDLWDFDDAKEMKKRYPKLFAKFGG